MRLQLSGRQMGLLGILLGLAGILMGLRAECLHGDSALRAPNRANHSE